MKKCTRCEHGWEYPDLFHDGLCVACQEFVALWAAYDEHGIVVFIKTVIVTEKEHSA